MRWLWVPFILALGLLYGVVSPTPLHAQLDERGTGQTFVIAFPDTTTNTRDNRFQDKLDEHVYIFIYSAVDTKVLITGNGYNRTVTPAAGKFKVIDLMDLTQKAPQPIVTDIGTVSNNTFRLEAQDPIIVYCFMVTKFGAEAFTPIPVEFWGTQYYAAGVPGEVGNDVSPAGEFNYNATSKMFPCEILVIAADSNTTVSMTPAGRVMNSAWRTTVTLHANQAYQIQSYVDTANPGSNQPEFAGTFIQSNKPIGVITGNTRAQVEDIQPGLGKNIYKNMLMEWIAPVEQHGREFVYMPTLDGWQITGQPNEKPEEKRPEEWVRVYGTNQQNKQTKGFWRDPATGAPTFFTITPPGKGGYHEDRIANPAAVYYKTDSAAQAFMNTVAAVKFLGTTGFGSNIGAKYDGVATFMTEMTPREQWMSFAPYYGAVAPSNMNHFVSVVTDTNSAKKIVYGTKLGQPTGPFNFRTRIKGTDLIWGYQTVNTGLDYYITGWDFTKNQQDTSVRFGGDVRATRTGHEEYRPGATKKKDGGDPSTASAGGDKGNQVLHPSEYEEYISVNYGYPLAPSRVILRPGDSLQIDTSMDCFTLHVHLKALNENPVGLKSVGLENAKNAKLVFVNPINPKDIIAKVEASFDVTPIDPLQDASATIVIKDRTNKTWRVKYVYLAERVDLSPTGKNGDDVDFGQVTQNAASGIQTVTITNPLAKDITIKNLKWVLGNQEFVILSPTVPPEITLKPGQSIEVKIQITPTIQNQLYEDSLRVILGCTEVRIKVKAETVQPCLQVSDLDFGTLTPDSVVTKTLRISNEGRGVITFNNPAGNDVITWLDQNFDVSQADKDRLKAAQLGPGEHIDITVSFKAPKQNGPYRTTARLWANTRQCRDTSVWTAVVQEPGPAITGYDWAKRWVTTSNPCTKSGIARYDTVVVVSNTGTSDFIIARIELIGADKDFFSIDTTGSGLEYGQKILQGTSGARNLKVSFMPKDERSYNVEIRLTATDGKTASAFLVGTGIESHITIGGYNFGSIQFKGAGATTAAGTVKLTINPTRQTTITDLQIGAPNAADFAFDPAGAWSAVDAGGAAVPGVTGHPKTTPWPALQPGTVVTIPVLFNPTVAGDRSALITAFGDFSSCDVPSDTLIGNSFTLQAVVNTVTFPDILTCDTREDFSTITNTGSAPIIITGAQPQDPTNGYFAFVTPTLPDTLQGGESMKVKVTFMPGATGTYNANVTYTVTGLDGSPIPGPFVSNISGAAHTVTVKAHINRDYRAFPGTELMIPVTLDEPLDEVKVDSLYITVYYNFGGTMLQLRNADVTKDPTLASLLKGTRLEGWTATIKTQNDSTLGIELVAPASGPSLTGTGPLLNLDFLTFLGSKDTTSLVFDVTLSNRPCATVVPSPGFARLDSVCGLNLRLITMSGVVTKLGQNSPNPFNPTTDIKFSVGLDNRTKLTVYNASGEKVAVLVDGYMLPGEYSVTWDASAQPSGLYYYRLETGNFSQTNTMMLSK